MSGEVEVLWKQTDMVEVVLGEPDDFLKVRETLTRIGVASPSESTVSSLKIKENFLFLVLRVVMMIELTGASVDLLNNFTELKIYGIT